ncbi:hypothetical protein QZH41_005500 [Actinostola sp. cb2023]|nr:hypothetical protein QZH41_005500 [Actinostola sp. cb2023]
MPGRPSNGKLLAFCLARPLPLIQKYGNRPLKNHPNQDFLNGLLHDINFGVHIGYDGPRSAHIHDNHLSARENPRVVIADISHKLSLGRKAGPYLTPPSNNFVGSPMGAVPKKHSIPTKWRIITDLSWPAGQSVNDSIPADQYSCKYDTLDQAISRLSHMGPHTLMSKIDLSDAFRHILVHPDDWELLGTWPIEINSSVRMAYFLDTFLPFGLRSSPALFLRFTDALAFVMNDKGVDTVWHYLDDFWSCGPPAPDPTCLCNHELMLETCNKLNFNFNPKKTTPPTTKD